jgi:hypothetical protein
MLCYMTNDFIVTSGQNIDKKSIYQSKNKIIDMEGFILIYLRNVTNK